MGNHGLTVHQGLLRLILLFVSLHVSHIHASPISNTNSLCPRGWYQYDRFCVTRGQGSSDRAVALYCDGFGGIGIKGLCIIKVHNRDSAGNLIENDNTINHSKGPPVSEQGILQPPDEGHLYSYLEEREGQLSNYPETGLKDDFSTNLLDIGFNSKRAKDNELHCPKGWSHYGSVCVYKPWSVADKCHQLNSVEFHGLCVKHADNQAVDRTDLTVAHSKEKRICCCASFKAKGNKYGC